MLDDDGSIQNAYTYDAYGTPLEAYENLDNRMLFTGQWYDSEIEQYYLRARMYEPKMMRFTGRDPVRGKFKEPLTLHKYLYCMNDPVNLVDPDGRWAFVVGGYVSNSLNVGIDTIKSVTKSLGLNAGSLFRQALIGQLVNEVSGHIQGSAGLATVVGVNEEGEAFFGSMYWLSAGISTKAGASTMVTYGFSPNANKLSDFKGWYWQVGATATEPGLPGPGPSFGVTGAVSVSKGWSDDNIYLYSVSLGIGGATGKNEGSIFGEVGHSWVEEWY